MQEQLEKALEKLNPDAALTLLFDYVRIRFPALNARRIIEEVLCLNIDYMIHEDFGFYSYTEHFYIGDVIVLTSTDESKGVLIELKGRGCRQMESYPLAQERSWYDLFMDALIAGGIIKRLDLAINDVTGVLDIPELIAKCEREECISVFRSFKSYASGELVRQRVEDRHLMGRTLYIGSVKSEVYFCIYQKNLEQYAKFGTPLEDAPVKNRFEIRLKNERAYLALRDLLTHYDAEHTAFSIINRYLRFVDRDEGKERSLWKLNHRWAHFTGTGRTPLKLTCAPEPYTLGKTLNWIARQVAPTLSMAKRIDRANGTDVVGGLIRDARLTDKHLNIIRQQTATPSELTVTNPHSVGESP